LRPDYEQLKRIGEKSHFCSIASVLAQAVYAQGRCGEADALVAEAADAARANDVHTQIVWRSTRAKILARRGDPEAAERLVREAVGFAAGGDFLHSHAEALMDLAEVLELAGRRVEAAEAVRAAAALWERKGNVLGPQQAQSRLDSLTG
jgi:ATP/maltotriose-dependent transcriptional regulator MalT